MGYSKDSLINGENIEYEGKLSWTEYIVPFGIGVVMIIICSIINPALIFFCLIYLLVVPFLVKINSEFVVTNKRVIMRKGIVSRLAIELFLEKIEGITVTQGILDRVINSGSIIITGTGGSKNIFKNIDEPMKFRSKAQEAIENISKNKIAIKNNREDTNEKNALCVLKILKKRL